MKFVKRRAVSPIVGEVIALGIVLGLIVYLVLPFVTQSNTAAGDIYSQYQNGQIKHGELLTLISFWISSSDQQLNVYLYNFGTYAVTPSQIYINGTQIPGGWVLNSTTGSKVTAIAPGAVVTLSITNPPASVRQVLATVKAGSGQLEFFLYTSDGLAYDWTL